MNDIERCERCHRNYPAGTHEHGTRRRNAEVVAYWRAHHAQGIHDNEIAARLNLGITGLRAHLNRAGIYVRGPYGSRKNERD